MTISLSRIIALLGAVMVTTAAPTTATTGPGLPADFPLAPALSACHPIVQGPEVICEWSGVDGHAVYTFYHAALPKAGYTLLPGAGEQVTPREMGALGFKKGSVSGALTVRGTAVTIQVITCPTPESCR